MLSGVPNSFAGRGVVGQAGAAMVDAPPAEAPLPREVRRNAAVLGAAVGAFGVSFGVLATTEGLTVAQACAMSLLVFTGASQFAVVGVVATGGSDRKSIV